MHRPGFIFWDGIFNNDAMDKFRVHRQLHWNADFHRDHDSEALEEAEGWPRAGGWVEP